MNETIPEQPQNLAKLRSLFGLLLLTSGVLSLGLTILVIIVPSLRPEIYEPTFSLYSCFFCIPSVFGMAFGLSGLFEPNKWKAAGAIVVFLLSIFFLIVAAVICSIPLLFAYAFGI